MTKNLLNDLPRKKLCVIIDEQEESLWKDPAHCKGLLLDYCSGTGYLREIRLLVIALEERIYDLLPAKGNHLSNKDYLSLRSNIAQRLREERGMAEEFALWAIDSWALALKCISEEDLDKLPGKVTEQSKINIADEEEIPLAKKDVHTIIVSQQREGQYTTISDAISNAQPGDLILIQQGVYSESLIITKPLEIEGVGRVIIRNGISHCISINVEKSVHTNKTARVTDAVEVTEPIKLINLKLEGLSKKHNVIDVSKGNLLLNNCRIEARSGNGIAIYNLSAHATLKNCTIHYATNSGIIVYQEGEVAIENCMIEQTQTSQANQQTSVGVLAGVAISKSGHCSLRLKSEIKYKTGYGVLVDDQGNGILEDCEIHTDTRPTMEKAHHGPLYAGVEISKKGTLKLIRCRIYNSKGNGVLVRDNGQGALEHCKIYQNALTNVEVQQESELIIKGGKICNGQNNGIFIHNNGNAKIEGCNITGNRLAGIKIEQGMHPIFITACEIHHGHAGGIRILNTSKSPDKTYISDCRIFANVHTGIEIGCDGYAIVEDSHVYDGFSWGILCCENGRGEIVGGTIRNNQYIGAEVHAGELTLRKVLIEGNYRGICFQKQGKVTVKQCTVRSNRLDPWKILDPSQVKLKGNKSDFVNNLFSSLPLFKQ